MQAIGKIRTVAVDGDSGGEFLVQRIFQSRGDVNMPVYVLTDVYKRRGQEIEYCMVIGLMVEEYTQFDQPIEIKEA